MPFPRRHSRRRSAELHRQRQSGPDSDQGGDIDGQQSPWPCVQPGAEVSRGKDPDILSGHDGDHEQAHESPQNECQNSGGYQSEGDRTRFQSAFRGDEITEPGDRNKKNDQCADRERDDESEQEAAEGDPSGRDERQHDTE